MKRKTAQRNGAAILWAVLVMLMISLISAGIILVDRMYYMREQEENNRVQAKFYAESAITLVQQDILKEGTVTDETTGGNLSEYFRQRRQHRGNLYDLTPRCGELEMYGNGESLCGQRQRN